MESRRKAVKEALIGECQKPVASLCRAARLPQHPLNHAYQESPSLVNHKDRRHTGQESRVWVSQTLMTAPEGSPPPMSISLLLNSAVNCTFLTVLRSSFPILATILSLPLSCFSSTSYTIVLTSSSPRPLSFSSLSIAWLYQAQILSSIYSINPSQSLCGLLVLIHLAEPHLVKLWVMLTSEQVYTTREKQIAVWTVIALQL